MNRMLLTLIFPLFFTNAALAESPSPSTMIEVPCLSSRALITPKITMTDSGASISFVSLWGTIPPYIVVNDEYKATVSGEAAADKFFGHIELIAPEVEYFTMDGCHVSWRNQ